MHLSAVCPHDFNKLINLLVEESQVRKKKIPKIRSKSTPGKNININQKMTLDTHTDK